MSPHASGPIAAFVGGSSCSIYALHYNAVHLMTTKIIDRLLTSTEEGKYDGAVQ